jgi:hypothetical protein
VWPGYDVKNVPTVFTQPVTFQGTTAPQFQSSLVTSPPVVTSPGTVATGGTVSNSLGYNAIVYASATTGISSAKIGTAVLPGSAVAGEMATYYVVKGQTVTLSYAGSLTWVWQAI